MRMSARSARATGRACGLGLLLWFAGTATAQINLCALQGEYPFPFKSDDFCGSLGLGTPNNAAACSLWSFLLDVLASKVANPLICVPDTGSSTLPRTRDLKGRYIPQALPDRRTAQGGRLPASLDTASVMATEGSTMNWLFKNIMRFAGWAPCDALTGSPSAFRAPAGFRLTSVLNLTNDLLDDYNLTAKNLPVAIVLKQAKDTQRKSTCGAFVAEAATTGIVGGANSVQQLCSGGHLVVLLRGTLSAYESRLDFNYNTVPAPQYGAGEVHKGFKLMADEIWDTGLRSTLVREFVNGNGSMRHVTISGQSLGAAVATLLSARAQLFLQRQCANKTAWQDWPRRQPLVTGVFFAAPHVGNAAFAADFNSRVNARRAAFSYDLTSQVPCTPKVTACANTAVPTQNPAGYWNYSAVGGALPFGPEDMPVQTKAWEGLKSYTKTQYCSSNGTSVFLLKQATHICSYLCKTSEYTGDTLSWCRLWRDDTVASGAGQYCLELAAREAFPFNPPFPPM